MLPLNLAKKHQIYIIVRVGGSDSTRVRLSALGIVPGKSISALSAISGKMIIRVDNSRIGISTKLAKNVIVTEVDE